MTYIIAEAGVNHNGDLDLAKQLVKVAAEAGADAVKFQTFTADAIAVPSLSKAVYQKKTDEDSESQYALLKALELNLNAHIALKEYCQKFSIEFMSTAFDMKSLFLLVDNLQVSRLKVASGEITNLPLLLQMAKTQKPIILSTGMSNLADIETALAVLAFGYRQKNQAPTRENFYQAYYDDKGQSLLKEKVCLLHCVSEYPTPFHQVNLRSMTLLQTAFGLPIGFSDHSLGIAMPLAAVALGASIIEKHVTLDKKLNGPDHAISLEPKEFTDMVRSIREIEQGLGSITKRPSMAELENSLLVRKSLVASQPICKGDLFTEDNLTVKRSGKGLPASAYWCLLNTVATHDYLQDEPIIE